MIVFLNSASARPRQMGCILLIAAFSLTGVVCAEPASERPLANATEVSAFPAWDRVFTDPGWQKSGEYALTAPSNVIFKTPPEKTQVRVLWCKDYLLVRFDCLDQSIVDLPGSDPANPARDLPYFKADAVEVFLDPVGDGRMYMEFELGPNNGVFDAIYFCTSPLRSKADLSLENDFADHELFVFPEWNFPGLQTAVRIWPASEGAGWSSIAAFPAKEILHRLGKRNFESGMKMKINFVRFNYSSDMRRPVEITNWAPVLGGCAHVSPAGMGTLVLGPP